MSDYSLDDGMQSIHKIFCAPHAKIIAICVKTAQALAIFKETSEKKLKFKKILVCDPCTSFVTDFLLFSTQLY